MDEQLRILGLTEQERKVYASCLKLGFAKASQISENSGIERQAVYYTLKLLMGRGMITETIKSAVKYYTCINPKLLISNLKEEKMIKENALNELSTKYHEFKGIHIQRPKVEQYEGIEGFKTAAREMINVPDKEVYSYITDKVINFRPIFLDPYVKERVRKKIRVKVITEKTQTTLEKKKQNKNNLREMKFMNNLLTGKDYEFAISHDKVIFLRTTDKEQYGIKIEDPYFAELQMNIFKLLWERLADSN